MIVIKALTVVIAGLLSLLALRYMMREMEAVKVRADRRPQGMQRPKVRLRQDPRTGVYYPEG